MISEPYKLGQLFMSDKNIFNLIDYYLYLGYSNSRKDYCFLAIRSTWPTYGKGPGVYLFETKIQPLSYAKTLEPGT